MYFREKLGRSLVLIAVLFSLLMPSQALAVVFGSNVVSNGDAAPNNLTGWTIKPGDAGLWGTWTYTNYGTLFDCTVDSSRWFSSNNESYAYQDIGVSDIDFSAAAVSLTASARLMSSSAIFNQVPPPDMTIELQILFLDGSGSEPVVHKVGLAQAEMVGVPVVKNLDVPQVPAGTTTIRVRLYFKASVPVGTMAYGDFDDISVTLTDNTPPAPGNGGLITTSNPTNSSIGLVWTAATDGATASTNLQYKIVRSDSDNLHDLNTIESNGTTVQYWTSNTTSTTVSGLAEEHTYYFNVIVKDAAGNKAIYNGASYTTGYTPIPATVTTQAVSSITATTATGNGNVTALGKRSPTQHGVVWSTSPGPTVVLDTKTADGPVSATGSFASIMTGLYHNTTYYVRAYATNETGTSYGGEVSFTTLPLVTADPIASPASGSTIKKNATISLSAEEGATIYYTTALNDATPADPDFSSPSVANGGEITYPVLTFGDVLKIKAIATVADKVDSAVATFSYTVQSQTELTLTGITVSDKVYDGNAEATADFTGATLSGTLGTDVVTLSGTPGASFLDAGAGESKAVTVSGYVLTGVDAEYYTLNTTLTPTATISKKALTLSVTANDKIYDGSTAASGSVSLDGIIGSDDVTATGTFAFADADAGNGKLVNVTGITLSGAEAGNYTVDATASTTANIAKADIAGITFENSTVTYDGTAESIVISGTLPAGTSVSYSGNSGTNAGTYDATAAISGGTNYNDVTLNATLTINKAQLVATVGDYQKTYGEVNPGFAVTVTGFVGGETATTAAGYAAPTASTLATAATDAGTATITISGGAADNYTFDVSDTGMLTIVAKALTATATANDKTYDGSTAASGSVSLDGIIGSDDVTATGTFTFADADAGNGKLVNVTDITLSGTKAGNYTVDAATSTTANIVKADISGVTYENSTVTYDGTAKSIVISGTLPAGTSVSYSGNSGTNAGTYDATAVISGGINYNDLTLNATMTINKAQLVATVGNYQKIYGESNPGFTVTVTGFVSGETAATAAGYAAPTASSFATAATDVGTATITISGGAADNYTFDVSDTGALTIVAKALTATATANDKIYDGSTAASGSVSLDGIIGSDDVTATGTFTFADADAGNGKLVTVTDITLSGTKAGNYTVDAATSTTADIVKADIAGITFENSTVTYDGTAKSIVISGTLPAGTSVSYSGNSGTNAGTYDATAVISGGTNYNDLTLNATMTINKAQLVATVGNYQKIYGESNPGFTVTVTGFVSGETAATAAGYVAPTASSWATTATDAGTATITISGGAADNYTFNISDTGALTITRKRISVTGIAAQDKLYDGTTSALLSFTGAQLVGQLAGDDVVLDISNAQGEFADSAVAEDIMVTVTGLRLTGSHAANYTLAPYSTMASIVDLSTIERPVTSYIEIIVNGQPQESAGMATTEVVDGRTVTTVSVDSASLSAMLEQEGEQSVVTIPVNTGAQVIVGELNGQMVRDMQASSAVLQVQTDSVTYTLPAAQINIDDVAQRIGVDVSLQDIQVRVQVAEPPQDTVRIVNDAANEGNYSIVVSPVEFAITCTYGDQTVEVERFNAYVERTVAIPDGVDPSRVTTGVVLNDDGTFSHVPTTIIVIDGRYYARISSLTNSVYSVIWNQLTFQDMQKHWAERPVTDIASRLIMQPDSSENFGPNRAITRGEFAATIVRALGLQPGTGESPFVDVKPGDEYYGYILTAREYRIMGGYNDGTFRANRQITREEAMSMIVAAMRLTKLSSGLQPGEGEQLLSTYTDGGRVSSWARGVVADCLKSGIMGGRPGRLIDPKASITRAEVAVIVQRLLRQSRLI